MVNSLVIIESEYWRWELVDGYRFTRLNAVDGIYCLAFDLI